MFRRDAMTLARANAILLIVAATSFALAPTASPSTHRSRALLFVGANGTSITEPSYRHFDDVHPRLGFRAGLLFSSPVSPVLILDAGFLMDERRVSTAGTWTIALPDAEPRDFEHDYVLQYITFPLRGRICLSTNSTAPYIVLGPELSILMTAKATDDEGDELDLSHCAEQYSFGLYGGVGIGSRSARHGSFLLELGFAQALTSVGEPGPCTCVPVPSSVSCLQDCRTRSIVLAAAFVL